MGRKTFIQTVRQRLRLHEGFFVLSRIDFELELLKNRQYLNVYQQTTKPRLFCQDRLFNDVHCTKNPIYVYPEMKLIGLPPKSSQICLFGCK